MYTINIVLFFALYHVTNSVIGCITRGRFPNNFDSDCRGYTMCLSGGLNLTKYDLLCPEHSIYSHLESQCTNVTSYQCLPHHNCTLVGDYIDPSSVDCTSYIACVKDLNNIITARLIHCPPDTVFSATENTCVNLTVYKCEFATESPKVLQVTVNQSPNITGNFSLNNAAGVFNSLHSLHKTILYVIALNIIINV